MKGAQRKRRNRGTEVKSYKAGQICAPRCQIKGHGKKNYCHFGLHKQKCNVQKKHNGPRELHIHRPLFGSGAQIWKLTGRERLANKDISNNKISQR